MCCFAVLYTWLYEERRCALLNALCASSSCQPGAGRESWRQCHVNASQFSAFDISQRSTTTFFLVSFL